MSAHADHETYLRAALHAAADSLEPRGDGLERIRARLQHRRPISIAWLIAASGELAMRAPAWLQDAAYQVADWYRLAVQRFGPVQAPGRHRSRAQGLLRPLAAMAVVMFIVAGGIYVAIGASTAIFPSNSSTQPAGAPRAGGNPGAPGPGASHPGGTQSALGTGAHPSSSASCKPASPTTAPVAQSPAASASPSPTPTDSSTTDTSVPSPADSASASAPASPAPSVAPPPPTTASPSPGLVAKAPC